ncbi:MAG: hypothetical protein V4669_14650 [Pseudomonadota bacterium]
MLISKEDGTAGSSPVARTGHGAASVIPHLNNQPAQMAPPADDVETDVSTPASEPGPDSPEEPSS